ncbi:uncharacterized protein ISCGN_002927 [Ixodes scapularis]
MERMVLARIDWIIEHKREVLHPAQTGFRKNLGTQDSLVLIREYLVNRPTHCHPQLLVAVDIKKAFDTLPHATVIDTARKLGVRGRPLNFIKAFLSGRKYLVKTGKHCSSEQKTNEIGVPQGAVLSPVLFNLAMAPLLWRLAVIPDLAFTVYADDITALEKEEDKRRGLRVPREIGVREPRADHLPCPHSSDNRTTSNPFVSVTGVLTVSMDTWKSRTCLYGCFTLFHWASLTATALELSKDSGFVGLLVAIHEDVPERDYLLENIQVTLPCTQAKKALPLSCKRSTCESRCLVSGVPTDPEPSGFARPRLAVRGFPVSGEKGILVVELTPGGPPPRTESKATQVSPEALAVALRAPSPPQGHQLPPPSGGSTSAAPKSQDRQTMPMPVLTATPSPGGKE